MKRWQGWVIDAVNRRARWLPETVYYRLFDRWLGLDGWRPLSTRYPNISEVSVGDEKWRTD